MKISEGEKRKTVQRKSWKDAGIEPGTVSLIALVIFNRLHSHRKIRGVRRKSKFLKAWYTSVFNKVFNKNNVIK